MFPVALKMNCIHSRQAHSKKYGHFYFMGTSYTNYCHHKKSLTGLNKFCKDICFILTGNMVSPNTSNTVLGTWKNKGKNC